MGGRVSENGRLEQIGRALDCLRYVAESRAPWTAHDLARRLEVSTRTAYRWIEAMAGQSIVEREQVPRARGRGMAWTGRYQRTAKNVGRELARIA